VVIEFVEMLNLTFIEVRYALISQIYNLKIYYTALYTLKSCLFYKFYRVTILIDAGFLVLMAEKQGCIPIKMNRLLLYLKREIEK
jgi:hypothetical protein